MQSKFKRLAIISDCIHVQDDKGNIATENHIYCRQMQALADHFEQVVICCPFVQYSTSQVTSIYKNSSIRFIALPRVGGNRLKDKLKIIKTVPAWIKAFAKAHRQSDIVYQRFPNNLNIPGFFYFFFKRAKVFATYTGTWKNYPGEPFTYRLQKRLLINLFRGPVAAYIHQAQIGKHIFKSFSPSYTGKEWHDESGQVQSRIQKFTQCADFNPVFITVGSLVESKNQQYILNAFKILHDKGFLFRLYIVGGGPLMNSYAEFIKRNSLQQHIFLTGKKKDIEVRELYRQADFVIQASLIEGFGKVPVEGFFHGVVPLLNNVGLASEIVGNGLRGCLFEAGNVNNLVDLVLQIIANKEKVPQLILNGRQYAQTHTLEGWANELINLTHAYFE